ncbi:biosynthetic-type acetolactate synthase large subunit [Acidaminobacter sp. JC074]|uniref:biosynthetic-type acetolactate synthase large subunit n=1 Tax=Acidaminobacter sp. JC074 TaxID=2530199 RepID=UPI001F0DB496|nr:biosynthetic-type acetolactate synthase large subunit [Acidaminobacter sp. JC074]MCH4889173.1 biosynthetic-type acetolactate synthase large subunit [Acidaminobacter sp. JC074]
MNNGAEILLKALKKQGVDVLFGYPGGAVIPLYDALYRMGGFKHYRTAHEQGAVHAADGYARATGEVGVCIATSGPGATNTITGIATAYMDSVPLVVITGQVPSGLLGKDSFQEIDITGVTFQITKHNMLIKNVEDLEQAVHDAFHIAKSGRPGPVLIDIPKDVFLQQTAYHDGSLFEKASFDFADSDKVKEVVELIEKAERPIIYAGGGVKLGEASEALRKLAIKNDIPVCNTLMGLGTFPRDHDLSLGLVGMHGFPETNLAIAGSDLILAIGARFSDRVTGNTKTFSTKSKVVHIDVDKTEFSKNIKADLTVLGDLNDLLVKVERGLSVKKRDKWKFQIHQYKPTKENIGPFHPKKIFDSLNEHFKDAVVSTDVGQHQMWAAQYYDFKTPRSFITSGGLGTMGFGLGAAIGVSVGHKESLLITGDGSFRMNLNELATVSKYKLPVTIVLFNNQALGMVRQWQGMFQDERYAETCIDDEVDYIALGHAFGINAYRVSNSEELESVLSRRKRDEPLLIECRIDKDEKVLPIVPPGQSISNFILG